MTLSTLGLSKERESKKRRLVEDRKVEKETLGYLEKCSGLPIVPTNNNWQPWAAIAWEIESIDL